MINYPKLNRNATNRVTIPLLDGGINLSDGCTHISDNQLIDAKNVWFDGQTLKTRPKVEQIINRQFGASVNDINVGDFFTYIYSKWADKNIYTHISIYYQFSNNTLKLYALINDLENFTTTSFKVVADNINELPTNITRVKVNSYKGTPTATDGTGIYVLVGLYSEDENNGLLRGGLIYEIVNQTTTGNSLKFHALYKNISEFNGANGTGTEIDELYKPIIYINGKGNKYSELTTTNSTEYAPASVYEGKNLLPSAMKFKFMSDGLSDKYILPVSIDNTDKVIIKLNIAGFEWSNIKINDINYSEPKLVFTKPAGKAAYQADEIYTYTIGGQNKTISVAVYDGNSVVFTDKDGNSVVLPQTQTSSNIEITAYKTDWDNYDKILNMTTSTEYGGGNGIYGGSRVFLGGYKNFICYSIARENTYFSENNYIAVGDSSSVTAFGKMGESLIIFKPNSIYATQTTYSDSVSAEQIQNGSVADVATTYCYFPIYQLTNEVGCDIPNSIKLCLNRLVFANTSNNVYCLVTQSNNSQRNVYCLSQQIKKKLNLDKNAFSATFDDYYLLFCENRVYVLNYNRDSYRYIYSYTNRTNNTSTRYLTWWYWELEKQNNEYYCNAVSYNNQVYLINKKSFNHTDKILDVYYYQLKSNVSDENCEAVIETKVFDFSIPERYKKIEKLYLGIGNEEYAEIDLTINTDKGEVYHRPLIISNDGKMSAADYGEEIRLFPYCNKVRQFNIKLCAKGIMSLENISIYYKQLGEVMS